MIPENDIFHCLFSAFVTHLHGVLLLGARPHAPNAPRGVRATDDFGKNWCFFHALTMFEYSQAEYGNTDNDTQYISRNLKK